MVECCLVRPGSRQLVVTGATGLQESAQAALVWVTSYSKAVLKDAGLAEGEQPALDPSLALPPEGTDLLVHVSPVGEGGDRGPQQLFLNGMVRVAVASLVTGKPPREDAAVMGDVRFVQVGMHT